MDQPQAVKSSTLSTTKADPNVTTSPSSTPERRCKHRNKVSSLATVPESDPRTHSQPFSPQIDVPKPASSLIHNDKERLAAKRNQYFHDALHERSDTNSAVEAVRGEALIYAQVQTNIKIESEHHFLAAFSHQLAARYNRCPSSTVISLSHGQCLFFGGSTNPAYTLTITALASELQPATNKRNAAVLQKHMEAVLRVPPARGMVRFIPVAEECLAWGSKTVAGRIQEAVAGNEDGEREKNKVQERRRLKALSLKRSTPSNVASSKTQLSASSRQAEDLVVVSNDQEEPLHLVGAKESIKVVRKKKSIIHTLFRTAKAEDENSRL